MGILKQAADDFDAALTANGPGRVDIIGNRVTWQTTGGYAGGSAYCSFDPVPAYR